MVQLKNKQLQFDIEKLLSYDNYIYCDITTDYDAQLGYILDIKDNAYFYTNESDRDSDDAQTMKLLENKFYF